MAQDDALMYTSPSKRDTAETCLAGAGYCPANGASSPRFTTMRVLSPWRSSARMPRTTSEGLIQGIAHTSLLHPAPIYPMDPLVWRALLLFLPAQ